MPGSLVCEEDIKRLRAMEMVAMRVAGETMATIGERFNCDPTTVKRHLTWAGKQGIIASAESRILDELVPLAINTYKTALENGDTFAAKHVLDKLGDMAERAERRNEKSEDRVIEMWMKDREKKVTKDGKSHEVREDEGAPVGIDGPNVLDAEIIQAPPGETLGKAAPGGSLGRETSAFPSADEIIRGAKSGL